MFGVLVQVADSGVEKVPVGDLPGAPAICAGLEDSPDVRRRPCKFVPFRGSSALSRGLPYAPARECAKTCDKGSGPRDRFLAGLGEGSEGNLDFMSGE